MNMKCFPFRKEEFGNAKYLFCFHHAGGSAACYRSWMGQNKNIEVIPYELPGNGARFDEHFCYQIRDVVNEATKEIAQIAYGKEIYIYGHSMGAIIAFLVCFLLEQKYEIYPKLLIVAGRHAPQDTIDESFKTEMGMEKLEEELRRLGGTPEEVFECDDVKNFFLTKVMNAYRLNESFEYGGEKIKAPILAHYGTLDTDATEEMSKEWAKVTTGGFSMKEFNGGHFFPLDLEGEYLREIISITTNASDAIA
ncbi:MAG: thioesterase [Pseudobutyrivibrio sp.]|uniref:thioesterase II family protein n=1 Tax=Pseudobutyrivibrio sp. TaxID=2014367 RepID=UPI0025F54759|nr:alpha/beta fold hydrolase [Pseudobutyrivibrio sp.]MBE5903193.1 thioesterase [Pseudobutyrivibrio sp.]